MNFDNLVHDLRILIRTWDVRSNHKKCIETFLNDKLKMYHGKKNNDTKTAIDILTSEDDNQNDIKPNFSIFQYQRVVSKPIYYNLKQEEM